MTNDLQGPISHPVQPNECGDPMWVNKIYPLQAIVELLDDDDFQKLACNPKARAIVEEVHGNRDAFRKYALPTLPFIFGCGEKYSEFWPPPRRFPLPSLSFFLGLDL